MITPAIALLNPPYSDGFRFMREIAMCPQIIPAILEKNNMDVGYARPQILQTKLAIAVPVFLCDELIFVGAYVGIVILACEGLWGGGFGNIDGQSHQRLILCASDRFPSQNTTIFSPAESSIIKSKSENTLGNLSR